MTQRIVDDLEPVEIEQDDGKRLMVDRLLREGGDCTIEESATVGDPA